MHRCCTQTSCFMHLSLSSFLRLLGLFGSVWLGSVVLLFLSLSLSLSFSFSMVTLHSLFHMFLPYRSPSPLISSFLLPNLPIRAAQLSREYVALDSRSIDATRRYLRYVSCTAAREKSRFALLTSFLLPRRSSRVRARTPASPLGTATTRVREVNERCATPTTLAASLPSSGLLLFTYFGPCVYTRYHRTSGCLHHE